MLGHELAELYWDLAGLTYEMALRKEFHVDVLAKHAARVESVEARLAEVKRRLEPGTVAAAQGESAGSVARSPARDAGG